MSNPVNYPEERISLTYAEINSPLWDKIAKHLEAKLQKHRIRNDNTESDALATAYLRGRIAEIKELRKLADLDKQAHIEVNIPGGDERPGTKRT